MMNCIRHVPPPPLDAYIDYFYYLDGSMPYPREKILPFPTLDLKINLGDALQVGGADDGAPFAALAESWCTGLWTMCHTVNWPLDMRLFGVSFKPGGGYPFLQFPLSELHNQVILQDAIRGLYAAEIREQLYAAPTIQAQFALLERSLLARLHEIPQGLNAVQYAVAQIARCHGTLSIRAMSDYIGISQNHLLTLFKRMVGVAPKVLARLERLRYALSYIDPTQPIDWALIAQKCGYYDQAHFSNDFMAFVGLTPTDYLRLRRRVHTAHPEHSRHPRNLPID